MALLYHWDFTRSENIADGSGMSFLDKKKKFRSEGYIKRSKFSF